MRTHIRYYNRMKICSKCGVEQPLDQFYRAKGTHDGLRGDCKSCFQARAKARYPLVREEAIERSRQWRLDNIERFRENQRRMRAKPEFKVKSRAGHLKRKYGITIEQYDAMLVAQGGGCAICQRPPSDSISLHVDHDHETGRIRGLLCFRCNNSLGDLEDSPQLLQAALRYIDGPTEEERRLTLARLAGLTPAWA